MVLLQSCHAAAEAFLCADSSDEPLPKLASRSRQCKQGRMRVKKAGNIGKQDVTDKSRCTTNLYCVLRADGQAEMALIGGLPQYTQLGLQMDLADLGFVNSYAQQLGGARSLNS